MICLVVQTMFIEVALHADELRQLRRRAWARSPFGPKPSVKVCKDLAEEAPGECAICLELLEVQPASEDVGCCHGCIPLQKEEAGPLQLPCGHTFHEVCVTRWIACEITCPLCRKTVYDISKCTRLLAGDGFAGGNVKSSAPVEQQQCEV